MFLPVHSDSLYLFSAGDPSIWQAFCILDTDILSGRGIFLPASGGLPPFIFIWLFNFFKHKGALPCP